MQETRSLFAAILLLAISPGAQAQDDAAARYAQCLGLVEQSPDKAVEFAVQWERRGGGAPAQHCRALGLIGQGYPEDGALVLERAGSVLPPDQKKIAAELFGQAAQAWIKVDNLSRALHDQNQALALDPDNAQLLIDRALVLGLAGKYFEALDDLNRAHDLAPENADIYAYRAAAYRRLDEPALAEDNVEQALKASPELPLALLERGYLRRQKGDLAGARQDWLAVALKVPDSALSAEAQANIEQMDLSP
jgi:tetratricopeptide (TPR) repeat protein